jgi:broad specificity phosphatase PhoE
VHTAAPLGGAAERDAWLDRLYESYTTSADGESLAEAVARLAAALRAVGDRFYGRTTLVVSHPVILSAFRASLLRVAAAREQVDALPDLALSIVDYLEGRFYLVEDFPMRFVP